MSNRAESVRARLLNVAKVQGVNFNHVENTNRWHGRRVCTGSADSS